MRFKSMAVLSVAAVLALAPQAFAMGGGGGGASGSGTISSNGSFSGTVNGQHVTGQITGNTFSGSFVTGAEPLSAFAVGLGLVGARLLRRRRQ